MRPWISAAWLGAMVASALASASACSSRSAGTPTARDAAAPSAPAPDAAAAPPADPRRWLAGDLHVHVAPPDTDREVSGTLAAIAESARQVGLDFVVLTPHLRESSWASRPGERRRAWTSFAANARAVAAPVLIPGTEWTTRRGHFTVLGVDVAAIDGRDFLAAAHAAGAFISVNHAFALPTHIIGVPISEIDMSYRVWTDAAPGFTAIDGAEVWNVPLSLANLVSPPADGRTAEARTWTELDRIARAEHRRLTAVGGTDNHEGRTIPTTWVLAADASEAAIVAALRGGATCVGGSEAGSFRARGDAGDWVAIGGAVIGRTITLAWTGTARLFVDDHDRGELAGGYVDAAAGDAAHTYRIVVGASRSGFIYANL